MAKHPGDISKFKRLDTLKNLFERHGVMDKAMVTQKMANRLDRDEKEIKRVLYRDLEELVNLGFIREQFFTIDGAEIHDFDPNAHKNYKKKWFLPGHENQITGSGSLERYGGKIICTKVLKNDLNLASNTLGTEARRRHLFFISSGMYFSLTIDLEALPISVILLRRPDDEGEYAIHESHVEAFGKRVVSLFLPSPMLSGSRDKRLGHLKIEILPEDKIKISDLGSKNGSHFYKLSHKEADKMRDKGLRIGEETQTSDWNQYMGSELEKEQVDNSELKLPILVEGSIDSRLLVL